MADRSAAHIAVILHDFSSGGSERIAIRLANEWAARGRRVSLLCGTEAGAVRGLVSGAITVEACTPETPRSPWSRIQLGWRLARLVRKHRPDIVLAPGNFHMIVLAILGRLGFADRPKFLCKISNPMQPAPARPLLAALAARLIRVAVAPIDVLIAMSPALADEARPVIGNADIVQIDEPVLGDRTTPAPAIRGRPPGREILCIGRFEPQKDFFTALQAFARLDATLGARLTILGEGYQRVALEAEVERLGLRGRVRLPGFVGDIRSYLEAADLFLMTSRFEGYPAVLIEALDAGLPIVTTPCSPAIREIVRSPALGTITASRSPDELAHAIADQLSRPRPTPDIVAPITARHRIGASATAYLDLFDRVAA